MFVHRLHRCTQIEVAIECGELRCEFTDPGSSLGWVSVPASRGVDIGGRKMWSGAS